MFSLLNALPGAISQGLIWGIMALGVYVTYRILDVADLTVDGSLATGGAVCVVLIRAGVNPYVAVLAATGVGAIAGLVTAALHTKCGIPAILAGILTQLALYSVNLRIMGGKSNQPVSVDKYDLLVSQRFVRDLSLDNPVILLVILLTVLIAVIYWFFGTEKGCSMRATGANKDMARAQGINPDNDIILGLMISNALVALSGALVAQYQGAVDVNMGRGAIVIGLASIIIGEVVFGKRFGFWWLLIGVVLGSIVYRLIIAIVLQLGMKTQDMKLLSAVVVIIALSVPLLKKKLIPPKQNNAGGDE